MQKSRHRLARAVCYGGRGQIGQAYHEGRRISWPVWVSSPGLAARAAADHGVEHVLGDGLGPAAVLALAGRGVEPLQLDSRMFFRSVSAIAASLTNRATADRSAQRRRCQ
ncbi:hypothetical protein SMA5143A_8039 [Streptomyces sp. MA5143a]|nr:hypothetical protein SMA5143A_8039 [Streptomyces sp. MA5143a]